MQDEGLLSIVQTVADLAAQIESTIEDIRKRGSAAFLAGDVEEASYQLDRLKWSQGAVQALRGVATELPRIQTPAPHVAQSRSVTPSEVPKATPVPEPVPALVVETPAKLKVFEPEPDPEPEDIELKGRLQAQYKEWHKQVQSLMSEEVWSPEMEAMAKAVVSEGREMLEVGDKIKGFNRKVEQQLDFMKDEFDRKAEITTFFGFNFKTHHLPGQWADLAQAYKWFGHALTAVEWLSTRKDLELRDRDEVVLAAAAAEANLHRKLDNIGKSGIDEQQRRFHAEIEFLAGNTLYIPYWNRANESDVAVENRAEKVIGLTDQIESRILDAQRRETMAKLKAEQSGLQEVKLAELDELLKEPESVRDFDFEVVKTVDALMELDLAPTSRRLDGLMPYRGCLELSENKKTKRVLEHLNGQFARLKLRAGQVLELESESEVSDEVFQRVKAALSGKRVLFLGGNKGQGWRQKEYKEKLGIEELVWPNFEEHTKTSSMHSQVDSADVVCYLIRWSRHSYKDLLDRAKEQGKLCVTLSRGVGLNTFVNSFDEQILQGQARAS